MIPTFVISLREFLEAFLIIGVFFGISKKLKLQREFEIGLAACIGITISLLLAILTYLFGENARTIFSEQNADFLEGYLLVFSGLFIAYVIFSLHSFINRSRGNTLIKAHSKLQARVFDVSLFFTIIFLIMREGFEVALFTASVSLFSAFIQNVTGLLFGFAAASILGLATFFAYLKVSIHKIFRATEYMIIILGASLVQTGVTKLFESHFHIYLSRLGPLPLQFLPNEESILGHIFHSFLGLDREFSIARATIMIGYILTIYFIFVRNNKRLFQKNK